MRKTYEIRVQKGRKNWYWKLISRYNGKTICHSETYCNKFSCMKTARKLNEDLDRSILVVV